MNLGERHNMRESEKVGRSGNKKHKTDTSAKIVKFGNKPRNSIVLGEFVNGTTIIHNVPYNKNPKPDKENGKSGDTISNSDKTEPSYELYLTYSVLFQLSHIFEYMQENKLTQMDYQEFIIKHSRLKSSSSRTRGGSVPTSTTDAEFEVDEHSIDHVKSSTEENTQTKATPELDDTKEKEIHEKAVRDNVLNNWLKHYFANHLQSKAYQPSMPDEESQTKAIQSTAWLEYFHAKLDQLSELDKELIERKYLKLEYKGRFPLDGTVVDELFISHRQYYYRKKEALYLLGLALGDSW